MLSSPGRSQMKRQRSVIRKAGRRRGHIFGSSHSRSNLLRVISSDVEKSCEFTLRSRRGLLRLRFASLRMTASPKSAELTLPQQKIPPDPAESTSVTQRTILDDERVAHTVAQKTLPPTQQKIRQDS